jgi:fructose transport system ATP-binding protein
MSTTEERKPILQARGLVKRYGHVTAIDGADFDLYHGEILAVIGDNGAGKSSLIKALAGAVVPDEGEILLDGQKVNFKSPIEARKAGIETVYQDLAVAPALDIATNLFLGREQRRKGPLGSVLRMLDKGGMKDQAARHMRDLQIGIRSMSQAVETLSGGQRQGVAVARSAAWARKLVIMDEPTAALGVRPGARADQARARQRAPGDPDLPQHAARVRDRRPHPRAPAREAGGADRPQDALHARGRGDHDRRRGPRHRAQGRARHAAEGRRRRDRRVGGVDDRGTAGQRGRRPGLGRSGRARAGPAADDHARL